MRNYRKNYPTLPEEISQTLAEYIEKARKIEDKNNNQNFHNFKQQLAFQLMVGVEELKSSGFEANIEAYESYDDSYHFCCQIAIEIIDNLNKLWKGRANQKFTDKFRELFFALKNDKSNSISDMNFRQKLVTNELSPGMLKFVFQQFNPLTIKCFLLAKFANMDKLELNSFTEQKRQMIEENYIKEKIVIEEPDVHFIKTSKGEEIISLSKGNINILFYLDSSGAVDSTIIENLDWSMMVSPSGSMEEGVRIMAI